MVSEKTHGAGDRPDWIQRLIAYCARNWLLTLIVVAAATAWGLLSMQR